MFLQADNADKHVSKHICNPPVWGTYLTSSFPFLFQASLLKNDETKALTPVSLQKELNNLLKFNPDFAEAVSIFLFIPNGCKGISYLQGGIIWEYFTLHQNISRW